MMLTRGTGAVDLRVTSSLANLDFASNMYLLDGITRNASFPRQYDSVYYAFTITYFLRSDTLLTLHVRGMCDLQPEFEC